MFDQEIKAAIAAQARANGFEPEALEAVVEVESDGVAFALIRGRKEPIIRFEGHYFDRRLAGAERDQARRLGLANPVAGAVKNPRDQAGRWKLLDRAAQINARAALESASYGAGQVMGANWQALGYVSVEQLVNRARSGVAGQIELMVRFIVKEGLGDELKRRDWAAFARGYNGPGFAKNAYHTKMAAAYARLMKGKAAPAVPSARGMLRMGSTGARVRELQTLLTRAGYPVRVDDDFGMATKKALQAFQSANGLEADGVYGPQSVKALERYRQGAGERPGAQKAMEIKQVRDGLGATLGGGGIETARLQVEQAGYQLANVPALEWVSTGLAVAAAALAIGGLAYAAHGWVKSRRTVEAPDEESWAASVPDQPEQPA